MISKQIQAALVNNMSKNDAAARSNERLIDLLRKEFNLKENQYLSDRRLKVFKNDIRPIVAEKYNCTVEDGRKGPKFVGKRAESAKKALNRVCGYLTAPNAPSTKFEIALKAVTAAVDEGMTEEQAKEIISLVK